MTSKASGEPGVAEPGSDAPTMVNPVGLFRVDQSGACFYVNEAWSDITGYPAAAAMGQGWRQVLHPDDMKVLAQQWDSVVSGDVSHSKYRIVRPDGGSVWVFGQASAERDAAGTITGFIGTITDIDALRRVESRHEQTVALLRAAMHATNDGILVTDLAGNLQSHNPKYVELLGISAAIIENNDRAGRMAHIAARMCDPAKYLMQMQEMLAMPEAEGRALLELADGRQLECGTRPQRLGGEQVGRVWSLRDVTAARRSEAALRRELHFRSELMEVIPNPVYVKDLDGRYIGVNRAWEGLFGPREEWLGKTLATVEAEEAREWRPRELELLASGGSTEFELRVIDNHGLWHDVIDSLSVYTDENGEPAGIIGVLTDITERKQAEIRLQESEEKFRLITENVGDLVALLDATGRRIYNSPSYHKIFGSSPLAEDAFLDIHPEDRERVRQLFKETVATGIGRMDQFRFVQPDGSVRYIESQGNVIRDEAGKVTKIIVVSRDITERKLTEEHIRHLAQHDALTNLPNRVLLMDRIEQAIGRAQRLQQQVALFFIDLDRFKIINDSLGHQMGDQVLLAVASRLTAALRETDTVARLGGDEFVVLLSDATDSNSVAGVARKALDAIADPILVEEHELHVAGSLGISIYPQDGDDADTLMRRADTAMYHAKSSGGNNHQFFTAKMNAAVQQRLSMETGLRQALARQEFVLHFQPQIDLKTGVVVSVEALLRWQHPRQGLILPGEFIRVAEETGFIVPLGEWVLREACQQNRQWQLSGKPPVRIAVNLSARQFLQKNLAETINQALSETGLDGRYLELEITESELMQYGVDTLASLNAIHELGVSVSIDDFGTGYSSLSNLKQLAIDRLKIDKSFVRDIHTDPDDAAIVAAIIAMGHVLKLHVVAEGVESESQLNFLRLQDCDEAQGNFIARPSPAAVIGELLGGRLPAAALG